MASRSRGKQRLYSPEDRRVALADVRELGQGGAARKHGIPVSTVSHWARAQESLLAAGAESAEPRVELKLPLRPTLEKAAARTVRRVAQVYTPSEKAQVVECARVPLG